MTDTAAFKGTYSDFKLVRTRGVIQVILEVPIEGSKHVLEVLGGVPNPSSEVWVAVARLSAATPPAPVSLDAPGPARARESDDERKEGGASLDALAEPRRNTPVARPDQVPASSVAPATRALRGRPLQVVMYCKDPKFWAYLRKAHASAGEVHNEQACAQWVKTYCDVGSRKDILEGTSAEQRWNFVLSAFMIWALAPEVGAA